ncbi:hypothetical protein A3J11_02265 [Candidatus Kaiserbacteria bacterium RIFCSPLOWO2_02_FULL_55_12]|uniref:Uncharacterized protein n=2 Tax=Candidatus Kaiseribacteriota TaxID=1752734 RepID=A0A1F6F1A4_9BACT|nr:MAG: hypothetical protein A3C94_02325 [Candidatus Kaiserbacteria bacterium RIFCSPHIGHO2_02_FULL_55_17]OGG79643.1 MAG: hypothetical protein A3J11_02265 [Candidatus Kaiserbacteria bacterium RIFCSPLOWO2_02_FULL_55_12]
MTFERFNHLWSQLLTRLQNESNILIWMPLCKRAREAEAARDRTAKEKLVKAELERKARADVALRRIRESLLKRAAANSCLALVECEIKRGNTWFAQTIIARAESLIAQAAAHGIEYTVRQHVACGDLDLAKTKVGLLKSQTKTSAPRECPVHLVHSKK